MAFRIQAYTAERIDDVLRFERELRQEESDWGWEIDEAYTTKVRASFSDPAFADSISLLAYEEERVLGRIDCAMIKSHFDGSTKAYLDWICVLKSARHRGVAQALLAELRARLRERQVDTLIALTAANEEAQRFYRSIPDSKMGDVGIWIDVK
jgi:ribosomal protein S18 acetylase RimI-like enzyme